MIEPVVPTQRRAVILTGGELRHSFVRMGLALNPGVTVLRSYCEGIEKSLLSQVSSATDPGYGQALRVHAEARAWSEHDFFGSFVRLAPDRSNPVAIAKGAVNTAAVVDDIRALCPDVLVAYGCSLVRGPLLEEFSGRFVNAHLGLSPYYRGAGTNVWALIDGAPELVGVTFMHMDAGIDTGAIIHQMRARVFPGDTPHHIGNRLIADMVPVYGAIVAGLDRLETPPPLAAATKERLCRTADFTEDAIARLYGAFADGLVARYLAEREQRLAHFPILHHPALAGVDAG